MGLSFPVTQEIAEHMAYQFAAFCNCKTRAEFDGVMISQGTNPMTYDLRDGSTPTYDTMREWSSDNPTIKYEFDCREDETAWKPGPSETRRRREREIYPRV